MGERFRIEINRFSWEDDYPASATGAGSMFWMHPTKETVRSVRDARQGHEFAAPGLRLLYRKNGLHIPPNHGLLCSEHSDEDITQLIEIHKSSMEELRAQGVWLEHAVSAAEK
jgi:glutamate-1-semialdehyde aminotransferase